MGSLWNRFGSCCKRRKISQLNLWNIVGGYELPVSGCLRIPHRTVFADDAIGIDKFRERQTNTLKAISPLSAASLLRELEKRMQEPNALIYTADMQAAIHLTVTQSDRELIRTLLTRYAQSMSSQYIQGMRLGSIYMRMLHVSNALDEAYSAIMDENLAPLFGQLFEYVIAMDMLYKAGRYDQVLEVHRAFEQSSVEKLPAFQFHLNLIVFASLYKVGTESAFDRALQLIDFLMENKKSSVRGVVYTGLLALNLSKPELVSDILDRSNISPVHTKSIVIQNIQVLALCRMGKQNEMLDYVNTILTVSEYVVAGNPLVFFPSTLQEMRTAVETTDDRMRLREFKRLLTLVEDSHLRTDDLDEFMNRPLPAFKTYTPQGFTRDSSHPLLKERQTGVTLRG